MLLPYNARQFTYRVASQIDNKANDSHGGNDDEKEKKGKEEEEEEGKARASINNNGNEYTIIAYRLPPHHRHQCRHVIRA